MGIVEYIRERYYKGYKPVMEENECDKIGIPEDLKPKTISHTFQWEFGFPQDDAKSLQQGSPNATANLDIWYNHQFVQNESSSYLGDRNVTLIIVERTPILIGTMLGHITVGPNICKFISEMDGSFRIYSDTNYKNLPSAIKLNVLTGQMQILWDTPPGEHSVNLSYEYDLETQG